MKKSIFVIAIAFISSLVIAQEKTIADVPKKVSEAFSIKYPSAEITKWKNVKAGYVAKFSFEKKKYLAYYSTDGEWKKTEMKINLTSKLPDAIKKALHKSDYASWTIRDIKHVQEPGKNSYTMHVHDGNKLSADRHDAFKTDYLLSFSDVGELIKKQKIN